MAMPDLKVMLPAWQETLKARGILEAAQLAGWKPYRWYDADGWLIPLHRADGQVWKHPDGRPVQRWKALNSQHAPKYTWGYPGQSKDDVKRPQGCDYYWLPGGTIKDDIDHVLTLACGEPDMLTFVASGNRAVTSFFGEGQIPANVIEVFTALGVKEVHYYPDNDNTGWEDTARLYTTFKDTAIRFIAYALPYELDGMVVNDINDLWRAVKFDTFAFSAQLHKCKPMDFLSEPADDLPPNNDESWKEYHEAIERALGATWGRNPSGWSKPMVCVFGGHEHDDRTPAAYYHREKHIYNCFKCARTWKGDEVAERLGIERPKPRLLTLPNGNAPTGKAESKILVPLYSSNQSLVRFKERLAGANNLEHLPFPFGGLHHLGGFCKVLPAGKITVILGLSGGGKTSFIETLSDAWRRMGFNMLWWSPEWSWEEMADRAIQRYGGLTMTEMMLYEMWLTEEKQGIPQAERLGVPQSKARIDETLDIIDDIMAWSGQAFYLDKAGATMSQLLDAAQNHLDDLGRSNMRPRVFFFDYIQLAEVAGARTDSERIPRAMTEIKLFACDNRPLNPVIGTQARKDDSEEARKQGALLTAEAAQYLRDDKSNLFISLNPEFDHDGNMTGEGVINVVKNSGGKRGKVNAKPDPRYLRWNDTKHQSFDLSNL